MTFEKLLALWPTFTKDIARHRPTDDEASAARRFAFSHNIIWAVNFLQLQPLQLDVFMFKNFYAYDFGTF